MKTFEGSITALATPFRNGKLDEDAYRALVKDQFDNGTDAVIPIGTTGEAVTLSAEEQFRAIQLAVEGANGRGPVIAGAGLNSTSETIEGVRRAREAGADAAQIVTPYYNKPTQAGLVEHYRQVAKAHPGFPIVAYNVPSRTGVDMTAETVKRLCDLPEVVALKESTGSMSRALDIVEQCGDRISLLSGDEFTVFPFIACGGRGVISVSSNVVPRMMSNLVRAARANDIAKARGLQIQLNRLHQLLFIESNPIPVKWALHLLGKFGPEIRLPLTPMSEGNAARLRDELSRLGLLQ